MKYRGGPILFNSMLILAISWSVTLLANSGTNDPESEIKRILQELDEEQKRLQSIIRIQHQPTYEVNDTVSRRFFRDAEENFRSQSWMALVRNLNSYLNTSQSPESGPYLSAQYMLGYAYQQLGYDERAARAYLRFLAAFITARDYTDQRFQKVLHQVLSIHSSLSNRQQRQLQELLSALVGLKLPREMKAEVLFLTALTASQTESRRFSEEWFEQVEKLTEDSRMKAQALFYNGILAVRMGRFEIAEERLTRLLQISDPATEDYQQLARLNLGRMAVLQNKPQTALGYYRQIPSHLPIFREALNEQIHIHLDREDFAEARAKAKMLMERYPDSLEAQRLRIRLALLSLQAGETTDARSKISQSQQELESLRMWLRLNFTDDQPLTHHLLLELYEKTRLYTDLPPLLERGMKLYARLAQIEHRLGDIRAEIRSLVLALGRLRTDQYHPTWNSRAIQLEDSVRRIMSLGDRITKLETAFYDDSITKTMKMELERSQKRRLDLQGNQKFIHERGRPASWMKLAMNNQKLAELHQRSMDIHAQLAGLAYFNHQQKDEWSRTNARILQLQQERSQRLIQAIQRSVELTRSRRIRDLANQGRQLAAQRLLINHALLLYEDSTLLAQVRDHFQTPNQRHMASEATLAWKKWEFMVKQLHEEINGLDATMRESLKNDLELMEQLVQSHDQLKSQAMHLSQQIARTLGHTMPSNLAHINRWIEGSQARLWKWEADLGWLDYLNQSQRRRAQQEDFDLRGTVVKEDLRDLEQRNRQ